MRRDEFLGRLAALAAAPFAACVAPTGPDRPPLEGFVSDLDPMDRPRSHDEWKGILSPAEFRVLFEEGTEPPGSSPLTYEHRQGTYICAVCYDPLFDSRTKYDSRTGWPTFWEPLVEGRVGFKADYALGEQRTEYH